MISRDAVKSKVAYSAMDSMVFDVNSQKVYLYGESQIDYEDINLKSELIDIDWKDKVLDARGAPDSTGTLAGKPEFSEEGNEFKAETIRYNFESKKGKITQVLTKQEEGYLHGREVKKDSSDVYYIKGGKYTTCDREDPHFYISGERMKVIKDSKIVCGPANMVVEGIHTPLAVPFGIFPNKKGQSSGIVIPRYGADNRGFFLAEGGYYFGLSDYLDLEVLGSIFSKLDYTLIARSNYAKRYQYTGDLDLSYVFRQDGEKEFPNYRYNKDYLLLWRHTQDPKAHPSSRFSADVRAGTSSYYQNNLQTSVQDALNNQFQSSISWTRTFRNSSLSVNARSNQNSITKVMDLSLPVASYNVNRFYPFRAKKMLGKEKWSDKIGVSYSADVQNSLTTYDSLINKIGLSDFNNGLVQKVPISTTFRMMKYFNLSPTFNYNERFVTSQIRKYYDVNSKKVETITYRHSGSTRDFNANLTLSTQLFGIYQYKNLPVKAIRHKMTPSLGFTWMPDFSKNQFGKFYDTYYLDSTFTTTGQYSYFEGGMFSVPPKGKTRTLTLRLANNLEMKTRNRKDTISGEKKITLLQPLDISTGYNLAADSMKLLPINLSAGTVIARQFNINFNGIMDPYYYNGKGQATKQYLYDRTGKLAVLNSALASVGFSVNPALFKQLKDTGALNYKARKGRMIQEGFSDFKMAWNLSVSYNVNYILQRVPVHNTPELSQALGITGDLSPTPNWKVNFSTGYDFRNRKVTVTTINLTRDLHCWQIKFNWVPFGTRQSYYFTLQAKANMLQDLKLEKKNDAYNMDDF